ncbi:MAG: hypothetical protein AB2551_07430 [Candidatus Thiodiazotropha sp.]|nr:hypothetical protein [Chromatiales bacterium]
MIPRILMLLPILFGLAQAEAASDDQLAAIRALGSLNGVALHCGRLDQTQRIKQVLVLRLPKQRQLGELFDYQTNKSFMAFINDNRVCPPAETFNQQIDTAIDKLNAVYLKP